MSPVGIASLWVGSDLTWLERLCIQSFLDRGHAFDLYTVGRIEGVPNGVTVRPASQIFYPPPFDITDNDRHRVAVYSDIFRLKLLQQRQVIWADLDAYCVRPFDFGSPYVFGKSKRDTYPTGVLGLPPDAPVLTALHDFVTSPNPTQPWRGAPLHRKNAERVAAGERWGIEALKWGCSGPLSFAHFLEQTGEARHALPPEVLYPLAPEELVMLHHPGADWAEIERPETRSVHIFGSQKRTLALRYKGVPWPGSYLEMLCQRHGIDPQAHPIRPMAWMLPQRGGDQKIP